MRPSGFSYHRADDLQHAYQLLAEFGEDGRPLAGGQSLVPMMNLRLARPNHLVDINRLPLNQFELKQDFLRIGALVRHHEYADNPHIAAYFPAFQEAVHWIAHPTIRLHGSLGGSISHADPTAELPAMCVLYDAEVILGSLQGERRVKAQDFFHGAYVTAVEPGEMVIAVEFPLPKEQPSGAFSELGERLGDFAIASIGVALTHKAGTIATAAIVCGGAEMVATRGPAIEAQLVGKRLDQVDFEVLAAEFSGQFNPSGDFTATTAYRKGLIGELTKRTLQRACSKALEAA
ncbi:xanthine dehydrogenase family protein subunit M [Paenochrobactrum glaciei]|uniref:Xanthine dehydrogenase family protein subunit M n=1 Tax=Paenochrobactrum glaciei TaxID=486407 RepID=A0ABN1G673_9HYPH